MTQPSTKLDIVTSIGKIIHGLGLKQNEEGDLGLF